MLYRITRCYLPPDRTGIPASTPTNLILNRDLYQSSSLTSTSWLTAYRRAQLREGVHVSRTDEEIFHSDFQLYILIAVVGEIHFSVVGLIT